MFLSFYYLGHFNCMIRMCDKSLTKQFTLLGRFMSSRKLQVLSQEKVLSWLPIEGLKS